MRYGKARALNAAVAGLSYPATGLRILLQVVGHDVPAEPVLGHEVATW